MKQEIKIGVICLMRRTFDCKAAQEIYGEILDQLAKEEALEIVTADRPVIDVEDAIYAGKLLAEACVDGIAVIHGTFHLGSLVLEIKKYADKPMLLWGLPELPYDGGRIRLNSVCGVNLNASNLTKSGYLDFTYAIGRQIDQDWLSAIRMIRVLRDSHIGLISSHAHGFVNVGVDELSLYHQFGTLIDHFDLQELLQTEAPSDLIDQYRALRDQHFSPMCDPNRAEKVAVLAAIFHRFMSDRHLAALAVRCWPEFANKFGISPCAAISLCGSQNLIISCEGDIDGALTMLCHQAIGAGTPFLADISESDFRTNSALMWHCGVAPCNLADGCCVCTLDTEFAQGKGVTAGFVLKEGVVSISRLDSLAGNYRLFNQLGQAVPMSKELSGTYARVRFDTPLQDLLDTIIYNGIAHHVSFVYGDHTRAFELFARLKGIKSLSSSGT